MIFKKSTQMFGIWIAALLFFDKSPGKTHNL